ncbi:MAG: NAD-dependent epimerase/dehydratase family protein [Bacteroidota bacterium]|nr:NAD-dependent epimerase/dehydratase family protein [Bacteroidota bacterium]
MPEKPVCLLTGATGFLGKYILSELSLNFKVFTLGRSKPALGIHIDADLKNDNLKLPNSFDFVVHCAGKAHVVPMTEAEIREFHDVNVNGTRALLAALSKQEELPRAFIFISSVSVYGLNFGTDLPETTPLSANDPYGKSKVDAEKLVTEWGSQNGVRIGILRLPLLVGKNPPGNLGKMIDAMRRGFYFRIGKGGARKSMVLAEDVAEIIPKVFEIGGTFNLTDGFHPSFKELEEAISAHLKAGKIRVLPYWFLKTAALIGGIAEKVTGKKMPVNARVLEKITWSLTFSDKLAQEKLKWSPRRVLENIDKLTV